MKSGVVCPRRQASSAVGLGLALGCSQLIQFANPQAARLSWEQLFLLRDVKHFPKTYRKPSCLRVGVTPLWGDKQRQVASTRGGA